MALIELRSIGSSFFGEFSVEAQMKIFGPHAERLEWIDIDLNARGREYIGRLPMRRLISRYPGVIQIVWKLSYSIGGIFSDYKATGYGNLLESWRVPPSISAVMPQRAVVSRTREFRAVPPTPPRLPKPNLTYIVRPDQHLAHSEHTNFEVGIDLSPQDLPTGGNCGEVSSRIRISYGHSQGESESESLSVNSSSGGIGAGIGRGHSRNTVTSEGGSFSCSVFVPYSG